VEIMLLPQYARVIPEIFDSEEVSEIKRKKYLEELEKLREQFKKEEDDALRCLNEAMNNSK